MDIRKGNSNAHLRLVQHVFITVLALLIGGIGLYWGLAHSILIFTPHNYFLSPLGDDGIDAVNQLYPMILHTKKITGIIGWYGDHRLGLARIQALFEYYFTNGIQILQPYRLAIVSWLNAFLFALFALRPIKSLDIATKASLTGLFIIFLFAGATLLNYGSTYMMTWPWNILFSLLSFALVASLSDHINQNRSKLAIYGTLFAMTFIINLAMYTFSIGVMLWFVAMVVMLKRLFHVSKTRIKFATSHVESGTGKISFEFDWAYRFSNSKHVLWYLFVFLLLAALSFAVYLHDVRFIFKFTLGMSIKSFIHNTFHVHHSWALKKLLHIFNFGYLTRILSVPVIPAALVGFNWGICLLGTTFFLAAWFSIIKFFRKADWSNAETVIFSLLFYNMIAVLLITYYRGNAVAEQLSTVRFTTPAFVMILSVFASFYLWFPRLKALLTVLLAIYAVAFVVEDTAYYPGVINDASTWNQFFIAESLGVPIDNEFVTQISRIQNEHNLKDINFLNDVQKKNQKGAYSLWMTPYVGHSLNELNLMNAGDVDIIFESGPPHFPFGHNPAYFLTFNSNFPGAKSYTDVLFTTTDNKIIGYGFRAINAYDPKYWWKGAINKNLMNSSKEVIAWLVDPINHKISRGGSIVLT